MLLSCSLWLPLALSGSLLLSEFAYNILARLTRPLLSSQRRCCAATLSASLAATTILNSDTMNENFSNLQGPRRLAMGTQYCSYACILGYVFTPGALQHVPRATAPTQVPIWGPRSPWRPFSDFESPFFFKVPIFSILVIRTHEKSVQPPSNVDHVITCDNTNTLH